MTLEAQPSHFILYPSGIQLRGSVFNLSGRFHLPNHHKVAFVYLSEKGSWKSLERVVLYSLPGGKKIET